ncbi:MAG: flavodoxin family protein [Nitrososphaeria archaeon]
MSQQLNRDKHLVWRREKMLIIGISGSPRVGGNTDMILQEALTTSKEEGAIVKLIRISDYTLRPCDACRTCYSTKKCAIDDDGEKLYQEIIKADGIILGSPSYFQGVTAQMKIFIDRIGYLAIARGRKDFVGKVGGVIAVARRSGAIRTCDQMIMFITAVRMIIPSGGRAFAIGREKGEVAKDAEGVESARYLGKMMVKTIAATESLRKGEST